MFNGIGVTGVILLVIVALLLFGPNKLPELGRAFGRTLREFKNGAKDIMSDDDNDGQKHARKEVGPSETARTQVIEPQAEARRDNNDNRRLPD